MERGGGVGKEVVVVGGEGSTQVLEPESSIATISDTTIE